MNSDKFKVKSGGQDLSYPEREEKILEFWRRARIFEASLAREASKGEFVFWEGPPTANGRPGIHHVLARTFKDIIPRFKTMRGFRVHRKAGWDTHGLPVELEVEKELKISGKRQIENIVPGDRRASIIEFNRRSRASVWRYQEEWERLTARIGFWLDLARPYVTYHTDYIETLWWILSRAEARGLLTKGFKSVPYCPRCGTTLSSHEVAQGYDEADDPSVFVLFENSTGDGSAFLVWTTTPWTLPGNVALAVNREEMYVTVQLSFPRTSDQNGKTSDDLQLILAKKRLEVLPKNYRVIREFPGSELVGREYKPLYKQTDDPKAYRVVAADFVSMEDGTGIVHIAPAFGAEDFELGQKEGLPVLRTVDEAGLMAAEGVPGVGKFVKNADADVIADLERRHLLFASGRITHIYPFCWRCKTPLLYYARDSWYLSMSQLRDAMIARNAKINWVPSHIRDGRFGEWLREIKDWAISRDRYWGTPLPIWICESCQARRVPTSLAEFGNQIKGRNKFLFLRHGEAEKDLRRVLDYDDSGSLTERGRDQIRKIAAELKNRGITKIVASPILRTYETAKIVGKALGVDVETDDRLREMDFGEFKGRPIEQWRAEMEAPEARWLIGAPGGENWFTVQRRMVEALTELNSREQGETILVVSHGDPLYVLFLYLRGVRELVGPESDIPYPAEAEVREEAVGLFDLHRPYVDELTLTCHCGGVMRRVPDVCDVWFDSGAMPFAQWGWRGQGSIGPSQYPADYIAEAIDQTRGWFYTLLAVATILEPDLPEGVRTAPPYRNVICLGHLLDEQGQKMSKSRGNVIDPWEVIKEFGADALRLYLVTMNQPGDPKRFNTDGVHEILRRSFIVLDNVWNYLETYRNEVKSHDSKIKSHVLDRWLEARLNQVTQIVTEALEDYDPFAAGRTILTSIDELSTWYLRRSRGRTDATFFAALSNALRRLALLLAPLTPFYADDLWQRVKTSDDVASVHLARWPEPPELSAEDSQLLLMMARIRQLVELGHADRNEKRIKLRQPLAAVTIRGIKALPTDLEAILMEELNVKAVTYEAGDKLAAVVDAKLTPELVREGLERELARQIQNLRKEAHLSVGDPAVIRWSSDHEGAQAILSDHSFINRFKATTLTRAEGEIEDGKRVALDGGSVTLALDS